MTKNTLFFTATLALFAIGCSGDDEDPKASGDTATDPTGDDDDDDTGTAPNMWDDAQLGTGVTCNGTEVSFSFDFLGEASGGVIDAADTSNASNWNDSHSLLASGITDDGGYTLLAVDGITVGVGVDAWGDGTGTVFTCEAHYDDPDVMTYVARAYDIVGDLADCVAWGEDTAGMIAGDYFNVNTPPDEAEIDGCRTISAAR